MLSSMKYRHLLFLLTWFLSLPAWSQWSAKWIQASDCQDAINTWQVFKKSVNLTSVPETVSARIAVDSKYWLWINGRQVVFEGGLKRGPSPKDTYFDEVNIAPFLKKGSNTIAILSVFFGKEGFSHKNSGHAALLFEAQVGNTTIISDATWEAAVYKAYGKLDNPAPNWRLPESSLCFDGRKSLGNWYMPGAGRHFPKARVLCEDAINNIYGELIKRPIPLFKDFGLKDYVEQSYDPKTRVLTCRLPYNAQITPYLKIQSKGGDTIDIRTDHDQVGGEICVRAAYITRSGIQEYESLGWMNGDKVFYKIPKGSKILAVKFRETGYDTEFVSHFRCNDPFFNELWKRSERTMYVNMRDTYFDCPDRERSQWWGDVVNDIQQSFYALSPSSWDIITKGIYELMNWQRPNGTIFSPIPAGNWNKELPCQMLMSVGWYGFRHQAFYSGDYSFVAPVYDRLHRYLHDVWKINDEGIAQVREGEWGFADWGDHIDMDIITTCWYYLALKAEKEFAEELEKMNDAAQIGGMMEKMEENFNHRFWKGDHYRSANYKDAEPDDRAQALAILCGFAGKDKYPALLKVFNTSRYASPFLELYVQKALFKMGEGRFALERAKERFGNMMSYKEYTTMFELWTISASVNHGWSSGMIAVFGEELCGIRPTSRGFKTFEICPDMAGLTEVSTQVETRYGFIKVNLKREGNQTTLCLTVPRNTEATVRFGQSRCRLDAGTYRMQVTETAPGYYIYNDIN